MEQFLKLVEDFLSYELLHIGNYIFSVGTLLSLVLIFLGTRLLLWLIKKGLYNARSLKAMDEGSIWSIYQIIRYILWVISLSIMLETIGVKVTVLLASSAALLVGVGLGLQQTFNDMVCGIILLAEGSIKVGDVVQIEDDIIMIQKIGLRTSKGIDRDNIVDIIPNSILTTNRVINWSHQSKKVRFRIHVGVAYGSDVDLVMRLLKESACEHPDVTNEALVDVWFTDFGQSSLNFQLLFFSEKLFRIERVKSDIRKNINRKFAEHGILIPFPQMDVHLKSGVEEAKS